MVTGKIPHFHTLIAKLLKTGKISPQYQITPLSSAWSYREPCYNEPVLTTELPDLNQW